VREVPVTRRDDDVVDDWHGEMVADPYRWLEDTESEETAAWVMAQNAVTSTYLEGLSQRDEIRRQLTEIWDVTRYTAPYHHGGKWFFTRHDRGANQPVLCVAGDPADEGKVLLDPNTLSADGTVALTSWAASKDGSHVVYATSGAGSDWMTWRVRDVETATDLDDLVEWSKFCAAAWLPDGSGFFYDALDAPVKGKEYLQPNDGRRLQLHLIGTPQTADELIYVDPDPQWEPSGQVTSDGRWLIVTIDHGTDAEAIVRVLDLQDRAAGLLELIPAPDFDSHVVGNDGSTFYVLTNAGAPRKRVVAIDLDRPEPEHWREVVPEGGDALIEVAQAAGHLVAHVLHDASSQLQIWTTQGKCIGEAAIPEFVTVTEISSDNDLPTMHLGLTSFTDPASVWACEVASGETLQVRDSALPLDVASIVVSRASAPSADGTPVPMFLVHRDDVEPTGDVKAFLWGYGGFDIPVTPTFNADRLVWVQRGGLLAIANLRGGGEFGREWHDAGRLANKQNVFNDFAGCARWLATSGWTRADRIVINGRSNGGLLVGAVLTQQPQLIGAAVPEVGVLDMLRYAKFTIGWAWIGDYGDPEDTDQYTWLRAYSPLHAITPGTAYPATLVMTGDHDDRVVPGHSFKFAATLQPAQRGSAPVLIRIEAAAGHGAGTPVSKLIEARADMLAFAESALGVDV
jgi:prolyl oligopeptidase